MNSSLTWKILLCRQNCGDKMNDFLRRTYYLDGGYDNQEGMSKLHSQMELIEVRYCKEVSLIIVQIGCFWQLIF